MGFMKFREYIDLNKKLRAKPTVDQVADYPGSPSDKPEKEKMHKNAGGSGQVGTINSYASGKPAKDRNKGHLEQGLATKGDKKLVYKAEDGWYGGKNGVSKSENGIPGGKKAKDWVATKSEAWVNKTKDLSLTEFINKIKKEKFTPDSLDRPAHKTIQETTTLCKTNKKYVSDLIREMKRKNVLASVIKEALKQPEFLNMLVLQLSENKSITRKFFNCLNETVAPPVGMEDEEEMELDQNELEGEESDNEEEMMGGAEEDSLENEEDDDYGDDEEPMDDDEEPMDDDEEPMDDDEEDLEEMPSDEEMSSDEDMPPTNFQMRPKKKKFNLDQQIENKNPFYIRKRR